MFCVIYGVTALWTALDARPNGSCQQPRRTRRRPVPLRGARLVRRQPALSKAPAAPCCSACPRERPTAPVSTLALAAGPVLVLALAGLTAARRHAASGRRHWSARSSASSCSTSSRSPWSRSGSAGGPARSCSSRSRRSSRCSSLALLGRRAPRCRRIAVVAIALAVGFPTTAIDAWNAQDVENTAMGPGFRWTVAVPPDTQAAVLDWIRDQHRPRGGRPDVDRAAGPRDVDAHPDVRRTPHGRRPADLAAAHRRVRRAVGGRRRDVPARPTPAEAARMARVAAHRLHLRGRRWSAPPSASAAVDKFDDTRYFTPVCQQGGAAVFAVR